MRGLAWTAVLSALAVVIALVMAAVGIIIHDWFVVANAGLYGLAAIALAMLSLRE
jgi:predicted Co/Zn/Cd cation transporter (cation efflux family)